MHHVVASQHVHACCASSLCVASAFLSSFHHQPHRLSLSGCLKQIAAITGTAAAFDVAVS